MILGKLINISKKILLFFIYCDKLFLTSTRVFFIWIYEVNIMAKEKVTKKKKTQPKENKTSFIKNVRSEMKKVIFPSGKEVLKYTVATLIFCFLLVGFFMLLNLGLSIVKGMF